MGKKAPKSARKFAAAGHLKKTIGDRRKHQQVKKKLQGRRGAPTKLQKKLGDKPDADESENDLSEDDAPSASKKKSIIRDMRL